MTGLPAGRHAPGSLRTISGSGGRPRLSGRAASVPRKLWVQLTSKGLGVDGLGMEAGMPLLPDAAGGTIGLYKTELIKKDGPWRSLAGVELATADYVD